MSGSVGCSGGSNDSATDGAGGTGAKAPAKGATDFVSADAVAGEQAGTADSFRNGGAGAAATAPGLAADGAQMSDPRSVAEGDIYRVLDNGTILNLNSYRGLQVIDVSDPGAPAIVGRVAVLGTPLEMYVRGDRAYVLLNDWQGYYGTREDLNVQRREGGLLAVIDLSDRSAPRQVSSELIRGYIRTSRLVANDSTAALYVASSWYGEQDNAQGVSEYIERTVVTSFDVAGDQLSKESELDLGGYVQDIQATPDRLLVASSDWGNRTSPSNTVALVDISDPHGQMVLGDAVPVQGVVQSQFNMDLYNGVLRVVSSGNFGNGANAVETFDARDIQNVTRLDRCAFGDGQQLYATVFLENKAFFVTYLRQDPFHAFAIGDDGRCEEHNEFVVTGWNDFLRPVAGGTRLIGVGTDDADASRTPAISLYDITDLGNANPLLARASAGALDWSWSEANSDHRAFSVLENAVFARDGTDETGLVLLPFEGYKSSANGKGGEYFTRVQIFTFSDHSVTRRGTMDHDSPVRRSFPAREGVIANLSESSLALHNPNNPDQPDALGQVEFAPDYGRVLRFGNYVARLKRPGYDYYEESNSGDGVP
ncbi:MAG TPA: beta-propeller domain-containing protein, partial [Polyangiales bacterium]|nr:beta-propeller domain-containing protein [Polyangiales bacterium]